MDVGIVANQSGRTGISAFSSLTKNFDTFLTLLTTQLRNQDPLEPLDTEKFTSQLVQFASVEQAIKTNSHLEALIALQAGAERGDALGLLGKTVAFAGDKAELKDGRAAWTYALPQEAGSVTLAVLDEAGRVVASFAGAGGRGTHAFVWDGRSANGEAAPGVYRLVVSAKAQDGAPIPASVETSARVTGARFSADGAQVETALGLWPLSAVRRVSLDALF